MFDLYPIARPFLFKMAPEKAHELTLKIMKSGLVPKVKSTPNPMLEQTLWGLKFPNPVGLSAGFDKNAEVIGPALNMGFGFVEAGTVTPRPQEGNLRPRIFRNVQHEAVINRMGFPNGGGKVFKANMAKFLSHSPRPAGIVGLNIGMNKTQKDPAKDYTALIRGLGAMGDYITINISSPNTPGLRDLQARGPLLELMDAVKEARAKACGAHPPPILVKLAPDLTAEKQQELAETLIEAGVDGLILTNTTLDRPEYLPSTFRSQPGGLSGQPLTQKSTKVISNFYRMTEGKLPIIGVGGISNAAQAYEKIKAGASLVQVYSALVFKGPSLVQDINAGLCDLLKTDKYDNISDAIGTAHTKK
ncbi:MAG: quinone-dependent dihydroorotate dehydrogenase [Micavibrio sp.]|nr:quinone-dependent dihydroorotate dehydrogenase [Micavibrio sp.]